jgi:hypothetical protein
MIGAGKDPTLDPSGRGTLEGRHTRPARGHGDDLRLLTMDRVQQRLEVRPASRDEDGDWQGLGHAGGR